MERANIHILYVSLIIRLHIRPIQDSVLDEVLIEMEKDCVGVAPATCHALRKVVTDSAVLERLDRLQEMWPPKDNLENIQRLARKYTSKVESDSAKEQYMDIVGSHAAATDDSLEVPGEWREEGGTQNSKAWVA